MKPRSCFNNNEVVNKKSGDISSYFDKNDEREAGVTNTSLRHMLTDSHTNEDNKREIGANLPLEHMFDFRKTFKKKLWVLNFN